jgi:hypothetical protein
LPLKNPETGQIVRLVIGLFADEVDRRSFVSPLALLGLVTFQPGHLISSFSNRYAGIQFQIQREGKSRRRTGSGGCFSTHKSRGLTRRTAQIMRRPEGGGGSVRRQANPGINPSWSASRLRRCPSGRVPRFRVCRGLWLGCPSHDGRFQTWTGSCSRKRAFGLMSESFRRWACWSPVWVETVGCVVDEET